MISATEIRRRAEARKLTLSALAESAGLSRDALMRLLAGQRDPKLSTCVAIARALRCKVDDLLA